MLNLNEDTKEKKNYKGSRKSSTTFELTFDNFLDIPRNMKNLNKINQEAIQETPTLSYYSGKLISSVDHDDTNFISIKSVKNKEIPIKEYSFRKNSPAFEMPRKFTGRDSYKKIKDMEFWEKNHVTPMILVNHNSHQNKHENFKCKIFPDF